MPLLQKQPGRLRAAAWVTLAVAVVLGVFAAIAMNVVDARRPFDAQVERSFGTAARSLGGFTTVTRSRGCVRSSVNWYYCSAVLRERGNPSRTLFYRLLLRDNGCWYAQVTRPAEAIAQFPELHSCVAGAAS